MTAWLEKHQVGAKGEDWSLTAVERFLVAGRALWFYAGKLFWPASLSFVYPRWQVSQAVWWQYIYPVLSAGAVVLLWLLRRRIGIGWLVGVLYFGGTLFPALGFLNVYPHRFSFVADHFQYLASLGLLVPACWLLWRLFERARSWRRWAVGGLVGLMLSGLGAATWSQGWVYQGLETLWTDTLRKNPDSFLAHGNLGNLFLAAGRIDEATYHYNQVLRFQPNSAEAWNNLSVVMAGRGETEKQIEYCAKALAIRPDYEDALFNMGNAMLNSGRLVEAEEYYRCALRQSPKFVLAQNNLGLALLRQGKKIGRASCRERV
jgi:tetratricopeptide (TPR) repeat protein